MRSYTTDQRRKAGVISRLLRGSFDRDAYEAGREQALEPFRELAEDVERRMAKLKATERKPTKA